jgi:integrase
LKVRKCFVWVARLKTMHLEWATFQVMRRTHATRSRQAGIDPKLVADQLGHGVGVYLDVYTIAALDQRRDTAQNQRKQNRRGLVARRKAAALHRNIWPCPRL